MLGALRVFLRRLLRRDRFERELTDELQFHLEARIEDLVRRGLDPGEARRRARLEFGGVEQYKERLRAARPGALLDTLLQDVRLSVRRLRREPTFALAVAVTLSLGIGASTAVFGVLSTTLLSRIPYAEPDRLVVGRSAGSGSATDEVSGPDYFDYRESSRSFESLAAFGASPVPASVTEVEEPWFASVGLASWNLFKTLRVEPVVGRAFTQEEEAQIGPRLAIISFELWQNQFGGAADVLERFIVLDGAAHRVVGVLPRSLRFLHDVDVWLVATRPGDRRDRRYLHLLARLKPGITIARAQRDVDATSRALGRLYPDTNKGEGVRLASLHEYLGRSVWTGLLLPATTTGCLLLVACANVAGMLLARERRRTSEAAMRSALGASRWRLVRQHLTGSVVLTLPAAALGVGVAYVLERLLLHLVPVDALGVTRPVVDGVVLLFAAGVSLATGLLVGIVPAVRGAWASPLPHLGTGRQAVRGGGCGPLRSSLVVAQIAASIVLLIGFGLVVRSFVRASTVDLGFSADHVLTAQIHISAGSHPERARRQAFFESVLHEVRALPGVRSAAAITLLPLLSDPGTPWRIRSPERPVTHRYRGEPTLFRRVSDGYFATMNLPLLKGRDILDADRDGAPAVAVLGESLARRLFPDHDPVGRTAIFVETSGREIAYQVVGVAGDAQLSDPRVGSVPATYVSILQAGVRNLRIVVRTAGDPRGLVRPIREIVRRKDHNVVVTEMVTMNEVVNRVFADFRRTVRYLGLFAGVALLLAAVGLYGALAYHVSQQEHEIGVRLALGATRAGVLGLVLRRGGWLVAGGLLAGLAAAYPGTRLVRSLLFETAPLDPVTYGGAVVVLGVVAATACLVPALRATRVDPAVVLRSE